MCKVSGYTPFHWFAPLYACKEQTNSRTEFAAASNNANQLRWWESAIREKRTIADPVR
jgi:hypothetical protein